MDQLTHCQGLAIHMALGQRISLVTGAAGTGKAQPLDAKILTPGGWIRMGEVTLGTRVIGADGLPHRVVGVYPQGLKQVFRVTMTDGASTECCADHLWLTRSQSDRDEDRSGSTKPLHAIAQALRSPSGKHLHWVPLVSPVEFATQDLPLHPYVLGLLLGDGCFRLPGACGFSNPEPELIRSLTHALPKGSHLQQNTSSDIDFRICGDGTRGGNVVLNVLRQLGLHGLGSHEKFIPEQYKYSKSGHRLALLQGLLDTDGGTTGSAMEYTTSSLQLAKDVVFLVQSLGGTATTACRLPSYTYRGEKRIGKPAHRINICLPGYIWPFRLPRKADAHIPRTKYGPRRAIQEVEPLGEKEVQCIATDSPDHLYVTDDFIVTHNTYVINKCMEAFEAQGLKVELAAPTGKAAKRLEQMTGRRAQTIHRLLGYTGEVWQKNGENPIESDVVILDEVSMGDSALMYHLMSAINFNRTKLLLAGDHNQLPPVGPGNVLRDILNLKLIPFTVLDEVVRQAGPLRHNSLEILKGHVLGLRKDDPRTPDWIVLPKHDDPDDALNYLLHLHEAVLKERLGYDLLRDVQVLSPQRSGVLGVENLNVALQAVLQRKLLRRDVPPVPPNRRPPLYPGDKVMQIKNDYGIDVMNGHIGFVVESDPKEKHWVVDFDDRGPVELDELKIQNVVLAYACTIHKCVTGDTLIPTDHGLTRIRDVASGVADGQSGECSFPVATEAGWGRAVRAFNGGRKPVLRIETRCGFSVTGSHEHPVRVATTDGMEWRLLKDVRPGDSLVLRKGTVYPDTPPLRTPVEAPIDAVNEELGWVLGVLVGDGNYTDTEDGRVEFGKIAPEMVLRYVAAVQTCLGVRTTVRRSSRQNCQFYSTYFHSRSVRAFLRWCGLGHDLSHRKCVPSAILNSPAAVQRAFLQGLFDSDGSVVGNAVILGTTSESLAREVQIMLMAHGMVSTCFMERPESNDGHWHSYWKVGLFGANAVKFGMTVGFSHELKDVRMAVAIHARNDEATKTNVGEIPFGAALASGLRDELRRRGGRNYPEAATVGRFLSAVVAGTRSLNDMNLEIVAKGVSGLGQIGPWGALAQLISDRGLFFDKVTDVSSGEAEVFDIEVPGDHSFIGNGIVCHNSQGSEVPCALCVVHSSHSYMLHRNLFYTAVTRARQRAIILGDAKGIQRAARIHRVDERQTILAATRGGVA